jgi:hypothetical protein
MPAFVSYNITIYHHLCWQNISRVADQKDTLGNSPAFLDLDEVKICRKYLYFTGKNYGFRNMSLQTAQ